MWLSQRLRERKEERGAGELGVVSIGGSEPAVLSCGEERALPVLSPGGYCWRPRSGETVLVVKGGALGTERYLVGRVQQPDETVEPGEVRIVSDGASIRLCANGRIELTGTLYINGEPYMPGEET